MQLNLSVDEIKEVRTLIEERLKEMAAEIHHVDTPGYHDLLKRRKALLEGMRKRIDEALPFASKQP